MSEFVNRGYLVTGAASGIGAATVEILATSGAHVVAVDRNTALLEHTVAQLAASDRVTPLHCDITDEAEVAAVIADAADRLPSFDGLVNAAGVVVTAQFLDFSNEAWETSFRINVLGNYWLIKYAAPHLAAGTGGRIVNVSSQSGKIPNQYTTPYAASKAAVISLTRSAAAALAPKITVNSVCPGIVDTPMWEQLEVEFPAIGAPLRFQDRAAESPVGRPGKPSEVAGAIVFLLSDASALVTGEDMNVSGGLVMH